MGPCTNDCLNKSQHDAPQHSLNQAAKLAIQLLVADLIDCRVNASMLQEGLNLLRAEVGHPNAPH